MLDSFEVERFHFRKSKVKCKLCSNILMTKTSIHYRTGKLGCPNKLKLLLVTY